MSNNPHQSNDSGWTNFMSQHNGRRNRQSYIEAYGEQDAELLKVAYHKAVANAQFPDDDTVTISLRNFASNETTALLVYLDKTQAYSVMQWDNGSPQIVIKDSLNIGMPKPPAKTMRAQQEILNSAFRNASAAPAEEKVIEQPYIPPFNVQFTGKGLYTLLDYMHPADVQLLEEAFAFNNIPFERKYSPTVGDVHVVKLTHLEALGAMMKTSRTDANHEKMPTFARIYHPTEGCPINLLQSNDDKCIPVEGMSGRQYQEIQDRLKQANIPFVGKSVEGLGFVLAVSDAYDRPLEALRVELRTAYNAIRASKEAAAETMVTPRAHGASVDFDLS